MKFGATLESSVAEDWRGYAVDYGGLKCALRGERRTGHRESSPEFDRCNEEPATAATTTTTTPESPSSRKPPMAAKSSPEPSPSTGVTRSPSRIRTALVSTDAGAGDTTGGAGHRRIPSALRLPSVGEAASSTVKTERHGHLPPVGGIGGNQNNRNRIVSWGGKGDDIAEIIPAFGSSDDLKHAAAARPKPKLQVTKEDIDAFFRIYENSKDRLEKFYEDKKSWATAHIRRLEHWADPTAAASSSLAAASGGGDGISSGESSAESRSTSRDAVSPEELRKRVDAFDEELDRIIAFLQLNQTAFSKILKKFDKNTGLATREARLGELRLTHGFLDGALFSELKSRGLRLRLKVVEMQNKAQLDSAAGRRVKPTAQDIINARKKRVEAINVDRTLRYLRKMELGSDFFSEHIPRQLPKFTSTEVELGEKLGQGEFATVKEVLKFMVKESCHLCFFHQHNRSSTTASSDIDTGVSEEQSDRPSSHQEYSHTGEETKEEHDGERVVHVLSSPAATSSTPETASGGADSVVPPTTLLSVPTADSGGGNNSLELSFDDDVSDYDDLEDDHNEELLETRGFMKDHCKRDGQPRYAVKRLRSDLDADTRREAALDLAIEAKFLAILSHPNIIKQRGTSGVPGHSEFFIILDKLSCNLTEKRQKWRVDKEKLKKKAGIFNLNKDRKQLNMLWAERLACAYDVARAMKHLHENKIVYRDLKPDNVGFDIRGDVKLFDFGLAKELMPRDRVGLDEYKASGLTGSRRYMAPEVVLCKPYGLSVDVFSFGIFLWELLALKEPFEDYDVNKHARLVVKKGQRPKMKRYWPSPVKQLLEDCWATDPKQRPTFAEIYKIMKKMSELRGALLSATERTRMLMDRSVYSLAIHGAIEDEEKTE